MSFAKHRDKRKKAKTLQAMGLTREEARRLAFHPFANTGREHEATKALLGRQIAKRLGIIKDEVTA